MAHRCGRIIAKVIDKEDYIEEAKSLNRGGSW